MKKSIKIILSIFVILFTYQLYSIYFSYDYLMEHSINIQTGEGIESCRKVNAGFLVRKKVYVCDSGYYKVTYPFHEKIFHFSSSSNQVSSVSIKKSFLDRVDMNTFRVINNVYAVDKNELYEFGKPTKIEGLNLNTVVGINNYYMKDNNSVFYGKKKIINLSIDDVKILPFDYPKDYDPSYPYRHLPIKNSPFVINNDELFLNGNIIKAIKINEFKEEEIVKVDINSFEILRTHDSIYAKDKNYVYCVNKYRHTNIDTIYVLGNADPETFNIKRYREYGPNTIGKDIISDINGVIRNSICN